MRFRAVGGDRHVARLTRVPETVSIGRYIDEPPTWLDRVASWLGG